MIFSPKMRWLEWVIISFVLLLGVAVAIPNFVRARETKCLNSVGNNLRIIEGAKEQWALENKKKPGDPVALTDLRAYFKNNQVPVPVASETYQVTTVGALATADLKGTLEGRKGPFTTTSF